MTNNYVVNALWNAASDALGHRDIESLKDVISSIETYSHHKDDSTDCVDDCCSVDDDVKQKSPEFEYRTMFFLDIVYHLDSNDAFNRFFSSIGDKCFAPLFFLGWLKKQPDISWITNTHNFGSQLVSILYRASNEDSRLNCHPYLKDVVRIKTGTYFYDKTNVYRNKQKGIVSNREEKDELDRILANLASI